MCEEVRAVSFDCEKPIYGPLGSCVGHCDRHRDHEGPCAVNGVTEADMLKLLADAAERERTDLMRFGK